MAAVAAANERVSVIHVKLTCVRFGSCCVSSLASSAEEQRRAPIAAIVAEGHGAGLGGSEVSDWDNRCFHLRLRRSAVCASKRVKRSEVSSHGPSKVRPTEGDKGTRKGKGGQRKGSKRPRNTKRQEGGECNRKRNAWVGVLDMR